MNHAAETRTADNGGSFDARQAASLLAQTTQRARRQFEPNPPWLLVIRAVVALGVKIADPLIGLAITALILRITWQAWTTVHAGDDHSH